MVLVKNYTGKKVVTLPVSVRPITVDRLRKLDEETIHGEGTTLENLTTIENYTSKRVKYG